MARASQNYYPDGEYLNKKNRVFSLNQEMLDKINNIPDVIDNLTSTSSTDALSANMGRELSKQIQSLESGARWLSTWDSRFGIPNTFPGTLPYQYKAGDNYLVSQVSDTANYRPDGSQFIGDRSFVVETSEVHPGDSYIYDGTNWILQVNSPIEVNEYTAGDGIKIDENNEISVKASAIAGTGLTTDTNNNLIVDSSLIAWKADIPTNVSQLINDRGYITENDLNIKTFYLQDRSDIVTAQEAYDWFIAGKNPILVLDENTYFIKGTSNGGEYVLFKNGEIGDYSDGNSASTVRHQVGLAIHQVSGHVDFISSNDSGTGGSDYRVLLTGVNYQDPYNPEYDGSPATKKYVDDNDTHIGTSAPTDNLVEGRLWYDTTNDILKVYNGSQWVPTGKTYTAGRNIAISNADVISATGLQEKLIAGENVTIETECFRSDKGPCPDGFHIATWAWSGAPYSGGWDLADVGKLNDYLATLGVTDMSATMKIPNLRYWAPSQSTSHTRPSICVGWFIRSNSSGTSFSWGWVANPSEERHIRPVKNTPVIPDGSSSWVTLFDGSSIATDAGVFWNEDEGIISVSSDGTNWITVADKNLGATQVWNSGDALTAANAGNLYQRGNNFGRPYGTTPTTTSEQIDVSSYGPQDYYYREVKFTSSPWMVANNPDLWGWPTPYGARTICQPKISATDTGQTYTAGTGINIDANNEITADTTVLATKTDLTSKQDTLTAGENIQIDTTTNTISATDTTYNAGENITIEDVCTTESDMKGPSPSGFHIPTKGEFDGLKSIMDGMSMTGDDWRIKLHMPLAGERYYDATLKHQGSAGYYWSTTNYLYDFISYCNIASTSVTTRGAYPRSLAISIRPFKNEFMSPTSSWTVIQGTLGGAGIFWDQTGGLISITSDGITGYTIADKNCGATTVYNDGDTLSQANMGNYYQWGNNYGFPSTGTISNTSSTKVDASNYGPGNYYYSSTFITTGQNENWSTVQNDNLRGGVSQGTFQDCIHNVISATDTTYTAGNGINIDQNDEISVDNTIARSSDVNTKTFYLANNSDLVTAQAAYDWWRAGKNPIVIRKYAGIESVPFSVYRLMDNTLEFTALYSGVNDVSYNTKRQRRMEFRTLNGTVNDIIFVNSNYINYIDPTATYSVPFIPTQDGQPATKKYVDDSISGIVIPTYAAGTGLTLNGTTFNVDTTTIATKEDIANLRTFIVVNTLPSVDTANEKAIYMLGPIGTGSDKYEEYIVTRGDYNWASATTMYPFSVTRNTWDGSILHDSQTSPLSDFNGECYVGAKITAISDETKLPVKLTFKDPDSTDSEWVGLNEPAFVYEQYAYPDGNDLDIYIPGTSSSNRVTVSAEGVMSSSPITREQGPKQRTKIGETSIDLSGYATTSALTTGLAAKQDTLTASTGININANDEITNTLPGPTIASTAPTGTEGALWYDTTNDVLMAHDGTSWKEAGTQMKVLSYGHSTWQDFLDAYNENAIVYCRASSNSNPGSGNQGRMAFMAYININNSTGLPTEVEFQYYRSRSDHNSAANQLDQVFVYKLTSAGAWTVTERNTGAKAVAGTGINLGRGSGNMTISADTSVLATQTDLSSINGIVSGQIVPPVSSEWEGRIFYCTTDNTFYKCDGTDWTEIGSGSLTGVITNNTTGTTTSISQIRCGTEAEYQALGTYQEGIAYMTF